MAARDLTGAVDFTVLERFTGGDSAVGEEVLDLFTEQAGMWSTALDPAGEGWRDAAHTIKGAAVSIGAADLAAACGDAETCDDAQADECVERVRDELNRALTDVAAFRHELMLRSLKG